MDIFGNNPNNIFDQSLNTTDSVEFVRVDVTDAIVDNSQLATKLYVDTHGGGGGGGNLSYVGTVPANFSIYKASTTNGLSLVKSNIIDTGALVLVNSDLQCSSLDGQSSGGNFNIGVNQATVTIPATDGIISNKFVKSGGTNIEYLMGDGSTLTQSANSGNSNFYLYQSINGVTTPPPSSGNIGYNNTVQGSATIVYISHLTRDNIDVEIFYNQVNQLNDLYIQDQNNSINFIKYNITGTPTPTPNSYLAVPVVMSSYGGNGNNSFGASHNVLVAFFSNLNEVDTRLSAVETKTQNITATSGNTTVSGTLTSSALRGVNTLYSPTGGDLSIGVLGNNLTLSAGLNLSLSAANGVICNKVVTTSVDYGGTIAIGTLTGTTITIGRTGQTTVVNSNSLTANSFIKSGGLVTEFLKANGTVDASTYISTSSLFTPIGLGNIDIMLRDSPFIGIQFVQNSGLITTLSNSLWSSLGSSSSAGSTYATTNNFTRQLCCASWTTTALADGAICGYGTNPVGGAQVSRGFNFGLSAVLGISDSAYNANNCQNFWGCWNIPASLNQATQLSVQRNMICFGSNTTDANICIYTGGALSTVKQVDLGSSFPANRPSGALSTDFFKFTLYWDLTKIYYRAINTTTGVLVSGSFTPLTTDIPAIGLTLYPQCIRVMGTPQSNGQARLQVQRFGVYYN